MSIIVKDNEILARDEIDALLKEQKELMDSAIDRWADSVDAHIGKMFSDQKKKVHFFAKMSCTLCGKDHYVNRMELVQPQNCMHVIAANIVNSCCGLTPDEEKIAKLNEQLALETDETFKKTIEATIENEQKVFQLLYLCRDCAVSLQKEFRKVLEQKIREIGVKNFI